MGLSSVAQAAFFEDPSKMCVVSVSIYFPQKPVSILNSQLDFSWPITDCNVLTVL